jgi:hypothetical protein
MCIFGMKRVTISHPFIRHEYRVNPDQHTSIPGHACPNCDSITSGNYCSNCGQETHLHHASLREFLHEFIGHYVALEGRLWGTLGRLLFRPGALTNEYIRGRRVRFVQPLRLYLTLSLIFFALLRLNGNALEAESEKPVPASVAELTPEARAKLPADKLAEVDAALRVAARQEEKRKEKAARKAAAKAAEADAKPAGADAKPDEDMEELSDLKVGSRSVGQWLTAVPGLHTGVENFEKQSIEEKGKILSESFYHYAPYAIFCMMPVFALFLKVLYLGSGRRFGEHLLFALHSNAFAFAVLSLTCLPIGGFLKFVLWIWLLGYLPWAMVRVYHKSRFGTAWRWLTLMACYMITLGLSFLVVVGAGVVASSH